MTTPSTADQAPSRWYGARLGEALAWAAELHREQARKGTDEPYLSHILMVAALVAHYGGNEDQIIAGALHDAVEDQGGEAVALEIERRFGRRVADIVRDCSDSSGVAGQPKAPWRTRKEAFLASLAAPDPHGARLVEACDKLANLRDIVEDVRAEGPETLERFRGGREGTRWYYQQIGQLLMPQVPRVAAAYDPLLAQFDALLESD